VYCCNIPGLMQKFGVVCKVNEWRLFIDSSKRNLKTVLLHNSNNCALLHIGRSVHLKDSYKDLELVLTKIGYTAHGWMICGDLKVLCMLLGQQAGYAKYPCFMCEWDSRANQHWGQNHWKPRTLLNVGTRTFCAKVLSIRRKCCHPFILN
jgi:hypothetical protein